MAAHCGGNVYAKLLESYLLCRFVTFTTLKSWTTSTHPKITKREQTAHILLAVEDPRQKTIELNNRPVSFSAATLFKALQSSTKLQSVFRYIDFTFLFIWCGNALYLCRASYSVAVEKETGR